MSDTPLPKKLLIKPGMRMLITNAPQDYMGLLDPLPEEVVVGASPEGVYDFVQVFVHNRADVERWARQAVSTLKPGGMLWFSYPKKSSGVKTDITRDIGWEAMSALGMEAVAQVAVNSTWAATRFRPSADVKTRPRNGA